MRKGLIKKIIIVIVLVILVCLIFFTYKYFTNRNKMSEVSNENYSFQYDNSWELIKNESLEAKLVHKKNKSELELSIKELENENQYKTIDEIFDSILYNIQKENESYKLLYKEQTKITKNEMDGYKILFENGDNQVEVLMYKQENKLVIFEYKASNTDFDILLDSVNSIIYSFKLNEKNFDVKTYIDIETKKIEYTEQPEVSNILKEEIECEKASSNYLVKYSIPADFQELSYNSRYGFYNLKQLPESANIKLNTNIYKKNIYEYLDKNLTSSLYEKYKTVRDERDLTEALDKYMISPLSYIYQNKYKKNGKDYENVVLIYELDQNHIFVMEVSATGIGIPKQLVEMLKLREIRNVASSTENKIENGFLIGTLKRYVGIDYKQTEEITLKLPEEFKEKDNDFSNMYAERSYISNYNEELKIPEYEVQYNVTPASIEDKLKTLENEHKKIYSKAQEISLNGKKFTVYDVNYSKTATVNYANGIKYQYNTNEKVLFYELQDNYRLVITINANEKEITEELLNGLTNFEVNIK